MAPSAIKGSHVNIQPRLVSVAHASRLTCLGKASCLSTQAHATSRAMACVVVLVTLTISVSLLDSRRGPSVKHVGTIQRILTWPLCRGEKRNSKSVLKLLLVIDSRLRTIARARHILTFCSHDVLRPHVSVPLHKAPPAKPTSLSAISKPR